MKKFILGIIIGILINTSGAYLMSYTRSDIYHKFGPILLEAIVLVMVDEINILRTEHDLQVRTEQDILNAIEVKQSQLQDYDWMEN